MPSDSSKPSQSSVNSVLGRPLRHKWFPAVVLASATSWWIWRAIDVRYMTSHHLMVVAGSAVLISAWYLAYGGRPTRTRAKIVGACWFVALALSAVFKPVYNGDMGIYSWRLRFAADPATSALVRGPGGEIKDWQTTPRDYPGFLGGNYWAEVKGVPLDPDWQTHPPQLVWRHEIGAGWSSFAIVGNYAFTQEQRGDQELVSCYRLDTGEPVWTHEDTARFDPADFQGGLGGIGPRATPTVVDGKVYTQGGTGIVNCLDARSGRVVWSHDTTAETGAAVTIWGKSGSPVVTDGIVLVNVGAPAEAEVRGKFDSSLVAYDAETGKVRWAAGNRPASYASPVVVTLSGERQVVMLNESYVTAHRARDGAVLWEYPWANESDTTASCVQPIPLSGDRVLLCKGYGYGTSLLSISRDAEGKYAAKPVWDPPINPAMKSKFANPIVHDGYVYGLDEVMLECMELETGKIAWKKRRHPEFGHGQVMLLGDKLLVLSETGELALVEATPERYHELCSIQALDEANITWNNPAFSMPYFLIRNAHQAACYRLPLVNAGE
jgi:outer membrane protein assembly factor BamB